MCSYDDEGPSFWRESDMKAVRKPWRCYECGLAIPVGVACKTITGKWDEVQTFRFHPECYGLAKKLGDLLCNGEWAYGQVEEHISELVYHRGVEKRTGLRQKSYPEEVELTHEWAVIHNSRGRWV